MDQLDPGDHNESTCSSTQEAEWSDSDFSSTCSSSDRDIPETSSESESDSYSDSESSQSDDPNMRQAEESMTEQDKEILSIMSFIIRHDLSSVASKDMMSLIKTMFPSFNYTLNDVLKFDAGKSYTKYDYCGKCKRVFPQDPTVTMCDTDGCDTQRFGVNKKAKHSFYIAKSEKQLGEIFSRRGVWESIQVYKANAKTRAQNTEPHHANICDISDGKEYRKLLQPGGCLHGENTISSVFNTDGAELFSSSNVNLWPIYLAINELSPRERFSRENMPLIGMWQGSKSKPPFFQYMEAFATEANRLYEEGFTFRPYGSDQDVTAKLAVIVGSLDLQAKGYVLNMTMYSGTYSCSACLHPGETAPQGRGHAMFFDSKSYPARSIGGVKADAATAETTKKRVNGLIGPSGLHSLITFDFVKGMCPEYMHGVLLNVMKTIFAKFFSPTNSKKEYYLTKPKLKEISSRMAKIKPTDEIERMPKDFEKRYSKMKATENQAILLFYLYAMFDGVLDDKYLDHLGLLSSGLFILLGNNISPQDLQKASKMLSKFYKQLPVLYGKGTCGLNVHNIGVHLAEFVANFGPLWCHSTFPFEDLNSSILHVHGTGDVIDQVFRLKENRMFLASQIRNKSIPQGKHADYMNKLFSSGHHSWRNLSPTESEGIQTAGSRHKIQNPSKEIIDNFGQNAKHCYRITKGSTKFYSRAYSRMSRRVCYYVSDVQGKYWLIEEFIINEQEKVFASVHEVVTSQAHQNFCHMLKVESVGQHVQFLEAENLHAKLMFVDCETGSQYLVPLPNPYGHTVIK